MKRLTESADAAFGSLTRLIESAEPYASQPFAKRALKSRISRALDASGARRLALRPALLGVGALLLAASAAAAGYSMLAPKATLSPVVVPAPLSPPVVPAALPPPVVASPAPVAIDDAPATETEMAPLAPPSSKRNVDKPRAGEDPTQVAEALRALRKQGDSARAQALLDRYLKNNPHGALAEDALALSIEAAAARKDPRAADYARRYLARYPNGRFRAVAERALSR
jgi:hypothetical protein